LETSGNLGGLIEGLFGYLKPTMRFGNMMRICNTCMLHYRNIVCGA
jgi:hypothetical protein